jgi:hypothetical protein
MIIYAFLLILLLRPSWGLWGLFSIAAAVLFVVAGFVAGFDPVTSVLGGSIQGVIFCGLGALIVFLRLKLGKGGNSRQDKEVDAELARIRAQGAARETQQPPPQQ